MNIFKRIFRIGQAEIHSFVEKMEEPIKMVEQGIREMREDLEESLEAYAKVKALAMRTKNSADKKKHEAEEFGQKAILLLQKVQDEELELSNGERLAKDALLLKKELLAEANDLEKQAEAHELSVEELQKNIDVLKFNINKWESELSTLRARLRVSKATKEVNKQMARIDSNSTISMLERMKEKVEEEEALSQAYGSMAVSTKTAADEIEEALGTRSVDKDLEELKKELGML